MTRTLRVVGVGMLVVLGALPSAFAAEDRPLQKARNGFVGSSLRGSAAGGFTAVSGSAELVTGVTLTCGSSACAMGLYDDAGINDSLLPDSFGRFEMGAAANTTVYVDLNAAPIRFTTGVMAYNQGAVGLNGGAVYTEQSTP